MPDRALSLLVSFALQGLPHCWMPDRGRYSFRYRLDVSGPANESLPELDTFYTLNVLLGFSQVPAKVRPSDIASIYASCCREAGDPRWNKFTYGMALWAAAKFGLAPPQNLIDEVKAILSNEGSLQALTAQDIGMLTSGTVAMTLVEGDHWRPLADMLIQRIRHQYFHPATHLFYNSGTGLRRAFASFASQVYPILALYQYGEAFNLDWPVHIANLGAARLIALQGRRGEWPWFYHVPGGRVVDFYEVYSVHQHGMAPAFLHHSVAHGVPGAREALVKGFNWLFGANEMGANMVRPAEHMFYRSQVRQGELESTWPRVRRSVFNALASRNDRVDHHRGLILRSECRSYELGWILWSFGDRQDYPELTGHTDFLRATHPSIP